MRDLLASVGGVRDLSPGRMVCAPVGVRVKIRVRVRVRAKIRVRLGLGLGLRLRVRVRVRDIHAQDVELPVTSLQPFAVIQG